MGNECRGQCFGIGAGDGHRDSIRPHDHAGLWRCGILARTRLRTLPTHESLIVAGVGFVIIQQGRWRDPGVLPQLPQPVYPD